PAECAVDLYAAQRPLGARRVRHEPDQRVLHGLGLLQRGQPDQLRVPGTAAGVRRELVVQLPIGRAKAGSEGPERPAPGPPSTLATRSDLSAGTEHCQPRPRYSPVDPELSSFLCPGPYPFRAKLWRAGPRW